MSLTAKLPSPPPEVAVDRSLDKLAPKFREQLETMLSSLGPDYVVAEAFRTAERQEFLYGFGRHYDDGRGIVTNAATNLTSWHGYGLAVDVIHHTLGWDVGNDFWQKLGDAAKAHGLAWGGDWRQRDMPHVQFGPPMRQSPSDQARDLFHDGGIEAVWNAVGAA